MQTLMKSINDIGNRLHIRHILYEKKQNKNTKQNYGHFSSLYDYLSTYGTRQCESLICSMHSLVYDMHICKSGYFCWGLCH